MKFKKLLATICSFLLAATSFLSGGSARAKLCVITKIILVGNVRSGKTKLCNRFENGTYNKGYKATIGAEFITKDIETDLKNVILYIWDTSGSGKLLGLSEAFYKGSEVFLLCIDLQKDIGEQYERWRKEVNEHGDKDKTGNLKAEVVLIGTKCDLVDDNKKQQFRSFAKEKGLNYFITSAENDYVENGDRKIIGFEGFVQKLAEMTLEQEERQRREEERQRREEERQRREEERQRRNKIVGGTLGGIGTVFVIGSAIFDVVKHNQNKKENKTKVPKAQKA